MSGLPKNKCFRINLVPATVDLGAYEYLAELKTSILHFVTTGKSLYLYSKVLGNGKTSWAVKLLQQFLLESMPYTISGGYFVRVSEFLMSQKQNITTKDPRATQLYNKLKTAELVVWDDIGVSASSYDLEILYSLINERNFAGLTNIYTGNLDKEQLSTVLGPRLASRIWDDSTIVEFKGAGRRRNDYIAGS